METRSALASKIVGAWRPVSVVNTRPDGSTGLPFGPNPSGIVLFEQNGHFVLIPHRPDLPKFATNNRFAGTAEENKAIVEGSLAFFGTYLLHNMIITMHVEGGTWPGWTGSALDRHLISLSEDEMKWTDSSPTIGGSAENGWARIR